MQKNERLHFLLKIIMNVYIQLNLTFTSCESGEQTTTQSRPKCLAYLNVNSKTANSAIMHKRRSAYLSYNAYNQRCPVVSISIVLHVTSDALIDQSIYRTTSYQRRNGAVYNSKHIFAYVKCEATRSSGLNLFHHWIVIC
jgi:hypothetical protein